MQQQMVTSLGQLKQPLQHPATATAAPFHQQWQLQMHLQQWRPGCQALHNGSSSRSRCTVMLILANYNRSSSSSSSSSMSHPQAMNSLLRRSSSTFKSRSNSSCNPSKLLHSAKSNNLLGWEPQ